MGSQIERRLYGQLDGANCNNIGQHSRVFIFERFFFARTGPLINLLAIKAFAPFIRITKACLICAPKHGALNNLSIEFY